MLTGVTMPSTAHAPDWRHPVPFGWRRVERGKLEHCREMDFAPRRGAAFDATAMVVQQLTTDL